MLVSSLMNTLLLPICISCFIGESWSLRLPRSNVPTHLVKVNNEGVKDNYTNDVNGTRSHSGGQGNECGENFDHCMSGNESDSHGIHLVSFKFNYVEQPFIISVFILAAGLAKLAFHHAHFISSRVPESCLLIILGIIVGAIMHNVSANQALPGLSSELFFLYLLPPIILESAYSLHDRTFYENVGTVILFAVIGTVLNCFLIGPTLFGMATVGGMGGIVINFKQCLVFSSIIVAVDPVAVLAIFQEIGVNNVLYFLVFGESLLNDAVTVVLYNMMKEFNNMEEVPVGEVFKGLAAFFIVSLGGLSIGIVFGVLTAIITKYTGTVRVVEPLAVFTLAYISYLVAELFHFSGIISIIGCGLTQAQYAFHNISQKSHTTVKYFSKMISATSDCIIFLFLGVALFRSDIQTLGHWHLGFIIWAIVLCLLYRFVVVFCMTWLINRSSRMRRIDTEEQFIIAYGGLRGAVAFSLMDLLPTGSHMSGEKKAIFMTTCLSVIFFTVFVQGISIKPLVKLLRVKLQEEKELKLSEEINSHVTDHVMAGIEEVLGQHGEHYLRELLEFYNRKYVKRMLMKDPISMDEQIMSCFEEIALQQHFENLATSKMVQEKYTSNEDLPLHIALKFNESIPEEDEEEEGRSSDEESGDDQMTVLPAVTIRVPSTPPKLKNTPDLQDEELGLIQDSVKARRRSTANVKRKSLFPGFGKKEPKPVPDEPTAKELRAMFTPSRRMLQHRKLDKNIRDESSTDLLKFLQEKQIRTRRMSRAITAFNTAGRGSSACSPTSTPIGSDLHLNVNKKSIDPTTVTQNYRRRLSLAVPERPKFQRDRSPSDVTFLKNSKQSNIFPFSKKKNFIKRGHSYHGDERIQDKKKSLNALKPLNQMPKSPSKVSKTSGFESIVEHEEADSGQSLDDTRSTVSSASTTSKSSQRHRRPRLQKSKTLDLDASGRCVEVKRSDTYPPHDLHESKVKFDITGKVRTNGHSKPDNEDTVQELDTSVSSSHSEDVSNSRKTLETSPQLRKVSYTQAIGGDNVNDDEMTQTDDSKKMNDNI